MRLYEIKQEKTLAIMAGGFHPFHRGHLALYNSIKQAMPEADVYVSATNAKTERPFPFEYKQYLASISGVPKENFIQVSRTYNAEEYLPLTDDPTKTVLVFVRSEKDRDEHPKPGDPNSRVKRGPRAGLPPYILSYEDFSDQLQTMDKHAYIRYMPTVDFGAGENTIRSATQIRNAWAESDKKTKSKIVKSLYPEASASEQKKAYEILDEILG